MSLTKSLLRATTLIAALGGTMAVAHAAPQLYAEAADETSGTYFALTPNTSSNGALTTNTATNAAGSSVQIIAQGLPLNVGLGTTTLEASASAGRSLVIAVTQTGLIATSTTMPFSLTFTVNGLLAPGSTASYADYISPTNAIFDSAAADLIKFTSLTATTASPTGTTATSGTATGLTVGQTYSETEFIRLVFGTNGSLSASSQLTPPATTVPEPASMALLGAGLVGIGMVRRRSRKA